jgi:hypothetical protein
MVSFNPLIKRDTLDFKETYNDKGLLHSFDGNPALIDEKNIKYFFNNGKLENKDINKATIIGILRDIWIKNGFIRKIHFKPQNIVVYFDSNGKLHRKFGPAITSTNNNIPEVQAWLQNGDFYRENELPHLIVRQKTPMLYSRNSLNDIKEEDSVVSSWMTKKGQLHNLNGPAKVIELLVKKDKIEHYYINGVHLKNKNHFYLEKIKKKSNFKL